MAVVKRVVAALSAAMLAALPPGAAAQADLKERFARLGMEPMTSTPELFTTHLRTETAKWTKIVRDSGARAE